MLEIQVRSTRFVPRIDAIARAMAWVSMLVGACGGAALELGSQHAPAAPRETISRPSRESDVFALGGSFESVMPVALTSFGGAALREPDGSTAIYVAGGYFGEPHRYSREGQSDRLWRYRGQFGDGLSGRAWESRAPLDGGLQGLALVAYGDSLVRCGGSRMHNGRNEPTVQRAVADCARYRPSHDAWEPFPSLPTPRSSFDAVSDGTRIWAVGGWDVQGDVSEARFHDTMVVFDGGAWSERPVPFRRRALAVVSLAGGLVVVGGMNADQTLSRETEFFDVASGVWRDGPDYPGDPFGVAATTDGTWVYASGRDGIVYRWGPEERVWSRFATLAEGRFFHRLFVRDGVLVAIGGIGSMTTDGRAVLVETIPLSGRRSIASYVEIRFPGEARNRPGLFVYEDSLFFLGGNNSTGQHDFAPEHFETAAFRLHLPSLRWLELPSLPEGRQSMVSVVLSDLAVALGGFGHDGNAERTYADALIFALDEQAASWRVQENALPMARTQFGAFVHEGGLYVVGGLEFDAARPEAEQFVHLASVLRCPIERSARSAREASSVLGLCEELTASSLPGVRRAFGGALLDGRYYVVGGMRDGFEPVPDCVVMDVAAGTWSSFACPSAPRISPDLVVLDGRLYLVGGTSRRPERDRSGPDRSVEQYDPRTGSWTTVIDELPFDTHQMRFVAHEHRIVGISTQMAPHRALVAWIDVSQGGG